MLFEFLKRIDFLCSHVFGRLQAIVTQHFYQPYCHEQNNGPFPSCFEPRYESEANSKVFIMKISFYSYANKTNFHMKSFALSLAFTRGSQQLANGLL